MLAKHSHSSLLQRLAHILVTVGLCARYCHKQMSLLYASRVDVHVDNLHIGGTLNGSHLYVFDDIT